MTVAGVARDRLELRFPCHPAVRFEPGGSGGWAECPECGSMLRVAPAVHDYDDRYPERRGHHDPEIGRCKTRSLERWLDLLRIDPSGRTVFEIGFGGGFCLAALHRRGAFVMGMEPVASNRTHAASLGVPAERLFDIEPLPRLPRKPDLWLFQDSFEHVPDPAPLVEWMARESAEDASVLLVAPDGGSASRRLLGRFWLHNVPDHWVHYSRAGVAAIFARAGFLVRRTFTPVKCVSLGMALRHASLLAGRRPDVTAHGPAAWSVWFNLGEMGLLLERDADRREATA